MQKLIWAALLSLSLFSTKAVAETVPALTLNWAPYLYTQEDGSITGPYYDIVQEGMERAGLEMDLELVPWARALNETMEGRNALLLAASYTEERAQRMIYSEPVLSFQRVFVKNVESTFPSATQDDLKPLSISALNGSVQADQLAEAGFQNIQLENDEVVGLVKLAHGRVDLALPGYLAFRHYLNTEPRLEGMEDRFKVVADPFSESDTFIAISKEYPGAQDIIDRFNAAIAEIRSDGTYEEILARY